MKKSYCDRCGIEIKSRISSIILNDNTSCREEFNKVRVDDSVPVKSKFDVCEKCVEDFLEYIL